MRNKSIILVSALFVFSLFFCFRENTTFNAAGPGYTQLTPFSGDGEQEGLVVSFKTLNKEESKEYLGRDLIDRGYQPVHITVQNQTANTYQFAPSGVSLLMARPQEVANEVTKRAIPRAIGLKILSFVFWPFMIPSAIDSVKTYKSHEHLKKHLKAKAVKEEVIAPYSVVQRVIYVPIEAYTEQFSLTFQNQETGTNALFHS